MARPKSPANGEDAEHVRLGRELEAMNARVRAMEGEVMDAWLAANGLVEVFDDIPIPDGHPLHAARQDRAALAGRIMALREPITDAGRMAWAMAEVALAPGAEMTWAGVVEAIVGQIQAQWTASENPLYVWNAIHFCLKSGAPLPSFTLQYLLNVSSHVADRTKAIQAQSEKDRKYYSAEVRTLAKEAMIGLWGATKFSKRGSNIFLEYLKDQQAHNDSLAMDLGAAAVSLDIGPAIGSSRAEVAMKRGFSDSSKAPLLDNLKLRGHKLRRDRIKSK